MDNFIPPLLDTFRPPLTGHQLHRGDQDVEGLREERDGRAEFDLHDGEQGASGISGRGKGAG